jgi:pentatricopeptide repeat protein
LFRESLKLFENMLSNGITPNSTTFINILHACSHSKLHNEATQVFELMTSKFGISPNTKHYDCLIDVLSRSGQLKAAENVINTMPTPGIISWTTLLGAARYYNNIQLAEHAYQQLILLNPNYSPAYVLLGNTYAHGKQYADAERVRNIMDDRKIKKQPGISWIEINGIRHRFVVRDHSHPQSEQIYNKLDELDLQLKNAGFRPDTSWVLQNIDEDLKERVLCHHRFDAVS